MCSTPRPKKRVNGRADNSGSLLSNLSVESRNRFTERANAAQEKRELKAIKLKHANPQNEATVSSSKKAVNPTFNVAQKSFSYWLFNARLKDIFIMLFFGISKKTY